MAPIIIPLALETLIKEKFDSDNEIGLWLLSENKDGTRLVTHWDMYREGQNSIDARFIQSCPPPFLEAVKANPQCYELIPGHMHARSYGTLVEVFDPYFTLPNPTEGHPPGSIVDGEFFVHPSERRQGDTGAIQGWARYFKDVHDISARTHLFVHPAYGSEGNVMAPELVRISGYELDAAARFGVRKVAVECRIVE